MLGKRCVEKKARTTNIKIFRTAVPPGTETPRKLLCFHLHKQMSIRENVVLSSVDGILIFNFSVLSISTVNTNFIFF